jgi:hypothetical protein
MRKIVMVLSILSSSVCMAGLVDSHDQHQGQGQGQLQGQLQGQAQGQQQGQASWNSNSNRASSHSSSSAASFSGASNFTDASSKVGVGTVVGVDSSDNSSSVYKETARSAVAGPLVTSNNTCMGSTTAASQALTFGFSLGSTWIDQDCVRRLDAAFLAKIGDLSTAKELMCQKEEIREAYRAAGNPCKPRPVALHEQLSTPTDLSIPDVY